MSLYNTDESLSDDEVYCGRQTLKELKKIFLWDKQPHAMFNTASAVNSPKKYEDHDASLKILQAHSQPNLMSNKENCNDDYSEHNSCWDMKATDDSFIKMENMVAKLCMSPKNNEKTEELNNTLEVIEYILNNPPSSATRDRTEKTNEMRLKNEIDIMTEVKNKGDVIINDKNEINMISEVKNEVHEITEITQVKDKVDVKTEIKKDDDVLEISPQKNIKHMACKKSPEPPQNTPVKTNKQLHQKQTDGLTATPRDIKHKPIFKTPAQPTPLKKPSTTSLKKTPGRSNAYQHISSPVASYINQSPIVPLVKDVHPKKPLPGMSSIPKFIKSTSQPKLCNKENVNLPSVAYKSAKKTRVIDMPDEQKMPQSQWAKKIMSTLPRPTIMKHEHRELNFAKKKLMSQQEDSFADLSYDQAEVSVCTQKTAFKTHKNF